MHVLHSGLGATLRAVVPHREHAAAVVPDRVGRRTALLGDGAFALRLPSALAGIAHVPVVWAIGARARAAAARALIARARSSPSTRCSSGTRRRRARTACSCSRRALAMLCFVRVLRRADARAAWPRSRWPARWRCYPLLRRVPAGADGAVAAAPSARTARRSLPALAALARRRARAAAADLCPGRPRHAVDRALGALEPPAGDPAVLPHRLLRRAARPLDRAARRAADPRRARSAPGACGGRPRSADAAASRRRPRQALERRRQAVWATFAVRRRRRADPARARARRRRLPRAAQPRRRDGAGHARCSPCCATLARARRDALGPALLAVALRRRCSRSRVDVDFEPALQRGNWSGVVHAPPRGERRARDRT